MHQQILVEFCNEAQHLGRRIEGELRSAVEHSLPQLQKCHPDLQRVVVALEQPAQRELADLYQGQVVVYDTVGKIQATARQHSPVAALKEALSAVEHDLEKGC